ncbi:MAG: AMP-binding protein, partial [Desulfobacula sp.]|nr:AMP-binding protein [Desulfobacula sp.]
AKRFPDKVALICGDQRLTYQHLNNAADKLAAALVDMDVSRQDRIIIFLDNSIESVISLFGVLKAGCIFIMLNATMKSKKLNYIIKDSGARVIITHINKGRVIEEAIQGITQLEHIIWCHGSSGKININIEKHPTKITSSVSWSELFQGVKSIKKELFPRTIDLDIATIIYTSGSTGEPKGVVCAHYNVVAAAKSITTYLENVEEDIILNVLPLSFDYGLYQIIMASLFGGTVILEKSFVYPYKILELLVKERATGFPIVPTMVAILLQMETMSSFDFTSLRYISNTAAALPVAYIRKIQKIFSQAKIFSMYGLTECKRVSYLPPELIHSKPESVGIPMPNEEVFIHDSQGNELGPGEIGELVVRGSNVMQGYWNAPEETAKTFKPGRYRGETLLYTGDLFKKDDDGLLYFVSRKDDMIKTKGERVSPKEIENVLCEMDGILEAAV